MIELTQMQTGKLIAAIPVSTLAELEGRSEIVTRIVDGIERTEMERGMIATDYTKMPPASFIHVDLIGIEDRGGDGTFITVKLRR